MKDTCESSVYLAKTDMLVQAILLLSCLPEAIGVQPRGRLGEEARTRTLAQHRQLLMSVCASFRASWGDCFLSLPVPEKLHRMERFGSTPVSHRCMQCCTAAVVAVDASSAFVWCIKLRCCHNCFANIVFLIFPPARPGRVFAAYVRPMKEERQPLRALRKNV